MTNSNTPPPPPALTLVEKLYAVHNINSLVPEKLDLQESNYSTWSYFFKGHCSNFNVLNHIDGSTSTSDPPTDEWITADSIVKSWIFLTLSPTLRKRMISTNPASAKAAWDTIETIFQENKRTRTVALKGELRVIQMGDDTPDAYFSKIDSIITLLTDLGSTMDDDDIVTYAINGLSEKYGSLAQIIAHKDPFPDLATVRTMVTTEEMRLRSKQPILSTSTTSSSPQVLLATSQPRIQDNRNNRDRDARNENKTEICRNFGRGYCRWGTNCRFIHASPKGTNNPRPNSSQHNTRSMQQGPGHTGLNSASQQHLLSLIQAQQNLLAQYGLSISQGQQPVQHNNTMGLRPNAPPGFQQTQPHQPTFGFNGHQQALYSAAVQNQSASSGSTSQETQLPHAFNTLTLQDPANSNWNMDTGASSHLNSSVNNLSTIFNSRIYPSVLVGDGKSIPVTNTGHSTLPTPYRTLHLNNVLITPNIVKNLISVRQFVRENKCTIEFDEFGFSVLNHANMPTLYRGDGVACIKRRRRDPSSDGVRDLVKGQGVADLNDGSKSPRIDYVKIPIASPRPLLLAFDDCAVFSNPFSSTIMGDENPICTLGDYSKPSHEGYRNTIELPVGNNVVPLQSDTIWLVQNGCSFHRLRSEDPNQHLKDFLKLVDSLNLDGENKERTRLRLFQFSLRDQASNWLERLPPGSITTWEDLTNCFLAKFFLGRTQNRK
ncbi:hybrid signal transduction histidine kinase M [Tanacetum coccineum]